MSNLKRFFLIIAIILGLVALALIISSFFSSSVSQRSEDVLGEQETGSSTPPENIPLAPVTSNIEPIVITEPEYLTEEEARSMRLSPREKIQVLERDEEGKVTAYKIIKGEADIVAEFISPAPLATSTASQEE